MRPSADPRALQPLISHLLERAALRRGTDEAPGRRDDLEKAAAIESLVELIEEDPALIRPTTHDTLAAFVVEPVSSLDAGEPLGQRATVLLAGFGDGAATTSVTHLRFLESLAVAVVRDAWDMAAEIGDVLVRGGTSPAELAAIVGLDVWETEAAIAGHDPGDDYFARRADLTDEERLRWITTRVPLAQTDARG